MLHSAAVSTLYIAAKSIRNGMVCCHDVWHHDTQFTLENDSQAASLSGRYGP